MTAVVGGLLAASSARLVYTLAGLLVLLGVAMVGLTIWLIRQTRPDPEVLSRLEVMGTRRWRKAGTKARAAQLDGMRNPTEPTIEADGGDDADEVGDAPDTGEDAETVDEVAETGADEPTEGDGDDLELPGLDRVGPVGETDGGSIGESDDTPSTGTRRPATDASP